jgi:hypothetical protein
MTGDFKTEENGMSRSMTRYVVSSLVLNCFFASLLAAREGGATSRGKGDSTNPGEQVAQQAAGSAPEKKADLSATRQDEIVLLREQIAQQQKQIEQLRMLMDEMKARLDGETTSSHSVATQIPSLGSVVSAAPMIPKSAEQPVGGAGMGPNLAGLPQAHPAVATTSAAKGDPEKKDGGEVSPLQLHIGSASIVPVGFMDFTSVWRNHTGGSGIGTNFGSIPYGRSSYQANLSEFRLSMQNSRVGFRVDAEVKGAHVIGYMESDFLGNNPGNVAVSSNSNTMRSRLYWADVRSGNWEVLGGQTWSLITPGRAGISPLPADIFYTQDMDVNYQLGLFWGRIPELRVVFHHPSNKVHFAVALDSPEQYVGGSAGGSLITFPPALSSTYAGELNVGTNTLGVPNVAPDVIAKLVLEPSKKFHLEIGGVERNFKVWNPTNNVTYTAAGGGGFLNLNFELFKGLRLMTNNFWSDGGGRYIFGQAPDLIVKNDGSPSLIHAYSTVSGFEYTHKSTMVYSYYGGLYVGRNFTIVPVTTTSGTPPVTITTLTPFGYGYTGSPSTQNKSAQEATFGIMQTFWKDARYGALSLITQYSYLARNPWYVAAGQPSNASLNMVFVDLRYTLPGSAPTLGR